MTKINYIHETEREYINNRRLAINIHSTRTYSVEVESDGVKRVEKFYLDRTLDAVKPFFNLHYFKDGNPISTTIKVGGLDYWGDGIAWKQAEQKAFAAINEFLCAGLRFSTVAK